ncbi:MAG: phage head-tail connector protein [Thiohalomonadales bacterium]
MGTLTIINESGVEPITINEAKDALRILHNDEDDRVSGLITASRRFAELYCGIHIINTVVELSLNNWYSNSIDLNTWPLQSVDSIKYDDTGSPSVELTLTPNIDYYADVITQGGKVTVIHSWPPVAQKPNPIRIRMTAGYTDNSTVPENIKEAIKAYCIYLYDSDPDLEKSAKSILWPERVL